MKRLVLTFAALATAQAAWAAEDVEFKHSGDFRARYYNTMNRTGVKDPADSKAMVDGRFRLNMTARKGEHVQAGATFVHASVWGDSAASGTSTNSSGNTMNFYNPDGGDGMKGPGTTSATSGYNSNILMVNRAWGWWKATDAMSFKFGRSNLKIADGLIFGDNDEEQVPTSHDGVIGMWDSDFGKITFFGLKNVDANTTNSGNSDPERNTYGVSLDFKGMPDMMKMANFHFIEIRQDEGTASAAVAPSVSSYNAMLNYQHLGLTVAGDMGALNWKLTGAYQMCKSKVGTASDVNLTAYMADLWFGYGMPETMGLKAGIGYHTDTGDKNSGDDKNESYQTMYYDRYNQAGLMNLVRWGNLDYLHAMVGVTPMEDLDVGVMWYMFSRQTSGSASAGTTFNPAYSIASQKADAKDIGNEIDVYAMKRYNGGMHIGAYVANFMPGAVLKDAATKQEATIMQIALAGGMSF